MVRTSLQKNREPLSTVIATVIVRNSCFDLPVFNSGGLECRVADNMQLSIPIDIPLHERNFDGCQVLIVVHLSGRGLDLVTREQIDLVNVTLPAFKGFDRALAVGIYI